MTATMMACSAMVAPGQGVSHEWSYVSRTLGELRESLQDTRSIGVQAVLDDLDALTVECGQSGWDGYDAQPLHRGAVANADRLIRSLGLSGPHPSLGANQNGWITMQWGRSARWTLSIAITEDGWIHWAMLMGSEARLPRAGGRLRRARFNCVSSS